MVVSVKCDFTLVNGKVILYRKNMQQAKTASEVIDALGGTFAVQKMLRRHGIKCTPQAVSLWRGTGRLPSRAYLVLSTELAKLGRFARPKLFGISEPSAM